MGGLQAAAEQGEHLGKRIEGLCIYLYLVCCKFPVLQNSHTRAGWPGRPGGDVQDHRAVPAGGAAAGGAGRVRQEVPQLPRPAGAHRCLLPRGEVESDS